MCPSLENDFLFLGGDADEEMFMVLHAVSRMNTAFSIHRLSVMFLLYSSSELYQDHSFMNFFCTECCKSQG